MNKRRLEWLYERKPIPTSEVYLQLVGRELFELCQAFPFEADTISFVDQQAQRSYAERRDELPTPTAELIGVLADLLDWELDHEVERIDHFMRNKGYASAAASPEAVETMHLLHQVLLECLLWRQEDSRHPLRRRDLHQSVEGMRQLARQLS